MADSKISALSNSASLVGTEELPIVQSSSTVKTTTQDVADLGSSVGLSATYTFGGGGSGDVATMTFVNGYLTAVTLVP